MRTAFRYSVIAFAIASSIASSITSSITGCGSSPEVTFYALSPTSGVLEKATPHAIRIRRPGLAGYLDRPEIVRRVVNYRLGVAATDRWGSPLDVMIGRVIAEDVELRLPGSSVYTEDGAITADADATVEIDIQRFDVGEAGELVLVAEVAIEKGSAHGAVASRGVRLSAKPKSDATPSFVAAMSDLLGQLADQVVVMLRDAK